MACVCVWATARFATSEIILCVCVCVFNAPKFRSIPRLQCHLHLCCVSDIKPENVLLTFIRPDTGAQSTNPPADLSISARTPPAFSIKIADLGFAKRFNASAELDLPHPAGAASTPHDLETLVSAVPASGVFTTSCG
jgi:serine/threonine protein kinase